MNKTIDFYFDFSSPYGYFSSELIDEVASRCECRVNWQPYLMGAVMKVTGRKPLVQIPIINDYSARDLQRVARYHGIEFTIPDVFPVSSVAACRAFYWIHDTQGTERAKQLARRIFRAYFINNLNISEASVIVDIVKQSGIDEDQITSALQDPDIKLIVRERTDRAIERNVFGSPFFIVNDEPFWGHDRLTLLEAWLKSGGW